MLYCGWQISRSKTDLTLFFRRYLKIKLPFKTKKKRKERIEKGKQNTSDHELTMISNTAY